MKLSLCLFLVAATLSGCITRSTDSAPANAYTQLRSRETQTARLREKLKATVVKDGVSKSEAQLIAECYFQRNIGCGIFTGIRDGGNYWIVDGAFGYAAKPIFGFHIDKQSGAVGSPVGPSYASPYDILP